MHVQVVMAPVADAVALAGHLPQLAETLRSGEGGFIGLVAGVTGDGRLVGVARFERSTGSAWWAALAQWLEGPVEVRASSDVELLLDGGSDGAGFVEIIEGRSGDRARFMRLERELARRFAAERPDFLGSTLVWWPDGSWLEVASFTSEADVRAGDARALSPAVEELTAAWEEVARPDSKLDLVDPFLSPGEAGVWVVAGCLFEIALPGRGWRWLDGGPEVTLLEDRAGDGRQHLRFRAEAPGAEAGTVELRFRGDGQNAPARSVSVRIAPERIP